MSKWSDFAPDRSQLDEVMRKAGEAIAKEENEKIGTHLITHLAKDQHFVKWFKKNYDFHIIARPTYTAMHDQITSITTSYEFSIPTWIPMRERIKRKLRNYKNCLKNLVRL